MVKITDIVSVKSLDIYSLDIFDQYIKTASFFRI